jgi:ABC-type phosphate transport system substrate-binding protein
MVKSSTVSLRNKRSLAAGLLAVTLLTLGLLAGEPAHGQRSGEVLAVIVHPRVAVRTLSRDELDAIFTLRQREWPNGGRILAFNLAPGNPGREQFDRVVLGMLPDEIGRFWIDRRVRGAGMPPRTVASAAMLVRVVATLVSSIGYVPRSEVTAQVKVVALVDARSVLAP